MIGGIIWRLQTLAFVALALAVFGAIEYTQYKRWRSSGRNGGAFDGAKNRKRQRRKRQSS